MDRRVPYSFGSAIVLAGAFAIGGVLHQSVIEGALPITSPAAVIGMGGGVALVVLGRAMERRFDPSGFVPDAGDGDEGDEEFDEAFSPISETDLEGRERDDSAD